MRINKLLLLIALTVGFLGGMVLFSRQRITAPQNISVADVVHQAGTSDSDKDQVIVTGKAWFEEQCPPTTSTGPNQCSFRVYIVDSAVEDVRDDTPKVALTENARFISCDDDGRKTCRGYTLNSHYKISGVARRSTISGNNSSILEVRTKSLMNK